MHQSRISMFETPGAANVTLETLARIAATFKTGLIVKFVPFSEMLRWENYFSQDSFDVVRIDRDIEFINPAAARVQRDPAAAVFVGAAAAAIGNQMQPLPPSPMTSIHELPKMPGMALAAGGMRETAINQAC